MKKIFVIVILYWTKVFVEPMMIIGLWLEELWFWW